MFRTRILPIFCILVFLFTFNASVRTAAAIPSGIVILTVTTNADDIARTSCVSAPLDCSLRGAIQYANTNSTLDEYTINIPVGTFTLTGASSDDSNISGDLDLINRHIHLIGSGDTTILDGDALDRVLDIHGGAVSVEHLEVTHGSVATGAGGGGGVKVHYGSIVRIYRVTIENNTVAGTNSNQDMGGGIVNHGELTVQDSTINNNIAYMGGGLSNAADGHPFTLENVLVQDNSVNAEGYGGGIAFFGPGPGLIRNSTLRGNTADVGGGGGLYNYGTLTLDSDTIDGNHALHSNPSGGAYGGGIHNRGNLTLRNVTIAGNDSLNAGGFAAINGSSATFDHCTFALNTSPNYGEALNMGLGSTTSLHNTIITSAENGNTCAFSDPATVMVDLGYNLSSDHSCRFSTAAPYHDVIDTAASAVFSPVSLGDYGGLTQTIQLFPHGPAVDYADPATTQTRDQRGYFRPMDGRSDIGAFEWSSILLSESFWISLILKPTTD